MTKHLFATRSRKRKTFKKRKTNTYQSYPVHQIDKLATWLKEHSNIHISYYKKRLLSTRLSSRLKSTGVCSLDSYLTSTINSASEQNSLQTALLRPKFTKHPVNFSKIRQSILAFVETVLESSSLANLRVWFVGCGDGIETLVFAACLLQELEVRNLEACNVKIFASDIHEPSLELARAMELSASLIDQVPHEIKQKYFEQVGDHYRAGSELRRMVLYTRHDVYNDQPFRDIDLTVCEGFLEEVNVEGQSALLENVQKSLNKSGVALFGKLPQSLKSSAGMIPVRHAVGMYNLSNYLPVKKLASASKEAQPLTHDWLEETPEFKVISQLAQNSIVISKNYDILAILGTGQNYLEFKPGTLQTTLDSLLVDSIRDTVLALLYRCEDAGEAQSGSLSVSSGMLKIDLWKIDCQSTHIFVVGFSQNDIVNLNSDDSAGLELLKQELAATKRQLSNMVAIHQDSLKNYHQQNSELQNSNDEYLSVNEELAVSNEELHSNIRELMIANQNLEAEKRRCIDSLELYDLVRRGDSCPILVIDQESTLLYSNKAASDILSIQDYHMRRKIKHIQSRLDFGLIETKINEQSSVSSCFPIEVNNSFFEVHVKTVQKESDFYVLTFVNYEEHREALVQARHAESRLYAILANIPAKVSVKNSDGQYIFANDKFCEGLDFSPRSIVGRVDNEIFSNGMAQKIRHCDYESFKVGQPISSEESFSADEDKEFFHTVRVPFLEENCKKKLLCSISVNITERIKSERKIRNFHNFFSEANDYFLIFEEANGVFWLRDYHKNLNSLLPNFNIEESSVEELLHVFLGQFCASERARIIEEVLRSPSSEFKFDMSRGGETLYFRGQTKRVEEREVNQILFSIFDITTVHLQQLELQDRQNELLNAARLASVGEMAAGIAHELKTPLNTIQAHVDILQLLLAKSNLHSTSEVSSFHNSVTKIENTVNTISSIIIGLKSLSKKANRDHTRIINVSQLLQQVVSACDLSLKNKGVRIDLSVATDAEIYVNETQLSQVFVNLINNSVDAIMGQKDRWIAITAEESDSSIIISFSDSGYGIPEAIKGQIMTPFFTTKNNGTGLGLSLSKKIIESYNGDLVLDETSDRTCFVITLPAKYDRNTLTA